jgi:hypothetical protein
MHSEALLQMCLTLKGEAIVSTRHYGSIMLAFYPASFLYSASFLFDSINRSISELLIHVLVNR